MGVAVGGTCVGVGEDLILVFVSVDESTIVLTSDSSVDCSFAPDSPGSLHAIAVNAKKPSSNNFVCLVNEAIFTSYIRRLIFYKSLFFCTFALYARYMHNQC